MVATLEIATEMFKKSTATDPDALSNLGVALGNDGNREGAMVAFKRAIALDPKHTQALTNLAGALNERGEHEQAARMCERAIAASGGTNAGAYCNLGAARGKQRDYEAAAAAFKNALDIDPNDAHAQRGLEAATQMAALVAGGGHRLPL